MSRAILALYLTLSPFAVQEKYTLDLTNVRARAAEANRISSGHCGRATDGGSTVLPVQLSLAAIDRTKFQIGETGLIEVVLSNVDREPVTLPWKSDMEFSAGAAETRTATFSLVIKQRDGADYFVAASVLQGAADVTGSLIVLRPGEAARIRMPVTFPVSERLVPTVASPDGVVHAVRVRVGLDVAPCTPALPITSESSIAITLRSR